MLGVPAVANDEGVRYQVPAPWRHLRELHLRVARWDLSSVELVDARCAERLCTLYPLDKRANAGALRRRVGPGDNDGDANADGGEHEPAPLLGRILHDQAATGLPALWLPHIPINPHSGTSPDRPGPRRGPERAIQGAGGCAGQAILLK